MQSVLRQTLCCTSASVNAGVVATAVPVVGAQLPVLHAGLCQLL
jgi:cell division protein FtsW (lipid II flippase)